MFYGTDDEFVAASGPFLRGALDDGHGAVVVSTPDNVGLVRDELGDDARHVEFIDGADLYVRPTSAAANWQRILDDFTGRGVRYVRAIGEVPFGLPDRHAAWTRYDSATNYAFAAAPAWIVCPYNTRDLPADVLAGGWRTHPTIWDGQRRPTNRYVDPSVLLREVGEPVPPVTGDPILTLPVTADIAGVRAEVRLLAERLGTLTAPRVDDLTLAVTELATNCLRHASGRGRVALWYVDGRVVCDVTDHGGRPIDPLAGYMPPATDASGGRGLWLTRHVCDALVISSGDRGNSIRFSIS